MNNPNKSLDIFVILSIIPIETEKTFRMLKVQCWKMSSIWVENSHKICNNARVRGVHFLLPILYTKREHFASCTNRTDHKCSTLCPVLPYPATEWCQTMQIAVRKGCWVRIGGDRDAGDGVLDSGALWSYWNANTSETEHRHLARTREMMCKSY